MREARASAIAIFATCVVIGTISGCLTLNTTSGGEGGSWGATESTSSSSSSSSGQPCMVDDDCSITTPCVKFSCVGGQCAMTGFDQPGTACSPEVLCDGNGQCVACLVDADCPDQGICSQNQCITCFDGMKNGDETGVDCGGTYCAKCAGDSCMSNGECISGYCVDTVCCQASCIAKCMACNLPGSEGDCVSVPAGTADPTGCAANTVCTSTGSCLLKNGTACQSNSNCFSNKCISGMCQP